MHIRIHICLELEIYSISFERLLYFQDSQLKLSGTVCRNHLRAYQIVQRSGIISHSHHSRVQGGALGKTPQAPGASVAGVILTVSTVRILY